MNSKTWKNKALTLCLAIATITTYSMVALANPNKIVGELLIPDNTSSITVNGQSVQNGNSIFSSSTIVTPDNTDAVVNLGTLGKIKLDNKSTVELAFDSENITSTLVNGKLTVMSSADNVTNIINIGNVGQVKLAPNTSLALVFDGKNIVGDLLAGELTALSTSKTINIKTVNGKVSKLNTGETVKAVQDDDDDDGGPGSKLLFALLLGGAAALIIYAVTRGNNDIVLGGGTTVVSPNQ